jgi:formate dehydrogenase maturation protein FdhE
VTPLKTRAAAESSAAAREFERRAARAELLAEQTAVSAEPLRFSAGLYRAQAGVAAAIEAMHGEEPFSGHLDRDVSRFIEKSMDVVRFAAERGPEALAADAEERLADESAPARTRLLVFWDEGRPATEDYLSRSMLRPYVEALRAVNRAPARIHRHGKCPFCGGTPWISSRREGGELEGARRMLGCALCGTEWMFQRILCPSCFEEDPARLPSFSSDRHANVRIEACETCRRYLKSVDLSLDARPIPEVDDLLSISLDLWAAEQGYTRLEPGLAGI